MTLEFLNNVTTEGLKNIPAPEDFTVESNYKYYGVEFANFC